MKPLREGEPTKTCQWCKGGRVHPARFAVRSVSRVGDRVNKGKGFDACATHLARAVDFVTVPGRHADVERTA